MAGTACTKTVSFIAKICQHATHILHKNVRVHFPDVHVMHRFHQSFIFRRAGKKLFPPLQKRKKESINNLVNIPHDFYFLQEGRTLFHLLLYILQAACFFFNIEKTTSQYPPNVQNFASQIFCLTAKCLHNHPQLVSLFYLCGFLSRTNAACEKIEYVPWKKWYQTD